MIRLASLLVLCALVPLPSGAQAPYRYRYESTTRSTVESSGGGDMDFSAIMGALGDQEQTVYAVLTVTTKDSARGKVYHVVVDSFVSNQGEMLERVRGMVGGEMGRDTTLNAMMNEMTASALGATIHRFVRDGKQVYQTLSLPRNAQLAGLASAVASLAPAPKMLTARWNDSWIDSSGIMMPGAGTQALPIRTKQGGFTKWRVTAKDTIDAVVATTMDMDADSAAMAKAAGQAGGDSTRRTPAFNISMKTSIEGSHRVVLDGTKAVIEATSRLESKAKMNMPMIGEMVTTSVATSTLIKIP